MLALPLEKGSNSEREGKPGKLDRKVYRAGLGQESLQGRTRSRLLLEGGDGGAVNIESS